MPDLAIFDEWALAEQRSTGGPVSERAGSGALDPMPEAAPARFGYAAAASRLARRVRL